MGLGFEEDTKKPFFSFLNLIQVDYEKNALITI
jgi:hypothetical protein